MERQLLFVLFLIFTLVCCYNRNQDKKNDVIYQREGVSLLGKEQKQGVLSEEKKEQSYMNLLSTVSFVPIDTASLDAFWVDFQNNLRNDNKQRVIEVFEYPIHAEHIVIFKFAYDCDTTALVIERDKYAEFDIEKNNIVEYYDFVFTDVLKEIIYQTSVEDLLSKGYKNTKIPGLTYTFSPKNYRVKVNCFNDHNLKFYITYKEHKWRIEIGGL